MSLKGTPGRSRGCKGAKPWHIGSHVDVITCVITKLTIAIVVPMRARMLTWKGSLRFDITLASVRGDLITRMFTIMRARSLCAPTIRQIIIESSKVPRAIPRDQRTSRIIRERN